MIENVLEYINSVSGGNQMVAGALTVTLSGGTFYLLKVLPIKIFTFFRKQLITTLTLNNTDYEKQHTFTQVTNALLAESTESGSRTLTLESFWENNEKQVRLTVGEGTHLIRYNRKWIWVVRGVIDSGGSDRLKEIVKISYIGRSHDFYKNLVEDFQPKTNSDKIKIYTLTNKGEWSSGKEINKTGLHTLALDEDVKNILVKDIKHFIENKNEYLQLGLPYKYTCILHGLAGSGKTSMIRALASDFNLNLCIINLGAMSDTVLEVAMRSVPKNSILLIEDFDSCSAVKDRKLNEKESISFLSLSGILNSLDGVAPLEDVIVFLTTNHLEKIDNAMIRSGRVDAIYELPEVSQLAVKNHLERVYNTTIPFNFGTVHGKDINAIKFKSKGCPDAMKKYLKEFSN
jgi:chaperone BCS1